MGARTFDVCYGNPSKIAAPHPSGCPSQPNFSSEDTLACALAFSAWREC
jgi:hypothetical protein